MIRTAVLIASLAAVLALPTRIEQPSAVSLIVGAPEYSSDWKVGPLSAEYDQKIPVLIALRQQNVEQLKDLVAKISDPSSPSYGQYLSNDEVNKMTMPRQEHLDAVKRWAGTVANDCAMLPSGVTMRCSLSVLEASVAFSTTFHQVAHVKTGQMAVVATDYSMPAAIADAVAAIAGLHELPLPHEKPLQAPGKIPLVTPSVLWETYGVDHSIIGDSVVVRQAVAEFQNQKMTDSDLALFFKNEVPGAGASDSKVYKFVGVKDDPALKMGGVEAQLDIQFIMGVSPGLKTEFWACMEMAFCADLKNWTETQLATQDVPFVQSVSYGWQGNLEQIGCKADLVDAIDNDFVKLAAKGISIIFASGDSGSGYAPPNSEKCFHGVKMDANKKLTGEPIVALTRNITLPKSEAEMFGRECCAHAVSGVGYQVGPAVVDIYDAKMLVAECTVFSKVDAQVPAPGYQSTKTSATKAPLYASWPASSPFVTSVGATRFQGDKIGNPEAAVSAEDHFGSGGGFSSMWKQPSWQKAAVEAYLSTAKDSLPDPASVSYDAAGRATPDVSALGTAYKVYNEGRALPGGVGGTSASAPAFAGMVSIINYVRSTHGKKSLGLLNPFLYSNADAFTDVTVGSDKVGRGGSPLPYGFNCTKGWDPVTGLGTPKFAALLKAALALP